MLEKNIILTTKDSEGRVVVLNPATSMYAVSGLKEYIQKKFDQFFTKIKGIFVMQEVGKELTSNDFTDEYKDKVDNLAVTSVKNIQINGQTIETVDGTITINTETVTPSMDDQTIEDIFNNI